MTASEEYNQTVQRKHLLLLTDNKVQSDLLYDISVRLNNFPEIYKLLAAGAKPEKIIAQYS